jgi:lysophospholipase L1-like esterase
LLTNNPKRKNQTNTYISLVYKTELSEKTKPSQKLVYELANHTQKKIVKPYAIYWMFLLLTLNVSAQTPVFLPLGDSYTICEGLAEQERWPNLLEARLKNENISIRLGTNAARTGYTTNDLIKHELPLLKKEQPTWVSLLIGVNDYVQGYDTAYFHKNLRFILNEIEKNLAQPTNIVLISIPDYSVTPAGAYYAQGRDVPADLQIWNGIIQKEALQRGLPFVDIFALSQQMKNDPSLVGDDGLHPSAKEVSLWAEVIYGEVKKMVLSNHR